MSMLRNSEEDKELLLECEALSFFTRFTPLVLQAQAWKRLRQASVPTTDLGRATQTPSDLTVQKIAEEKFPIFFHNPFQIMSKNRNLY